MNSPSIYVSYAAADAVFAERLTRAITDAGFTLAVNRHTVPPGQPLETALRNAMATAACFVVCFSSRDGAPPAYDMGELLLAIEQITASVADDFRLVPVKLTRCDLPLLPMGTGTLRELASIDMYGSWESGVARLIAALPPRAVPSDAQPSGPVATPLLAIKMDSLNADTFIADNVDGVNTGASGHTSVEVKHVTTGQFTVANVRGKR